MDLELLYVGFALDGDKGRVRALRDNSDPLTLGVLLGQICQQARDLLDILRGMPLVLRPAERLGLVADDVVPVGCRLRELVLEELRQEGRADAEGKDLVLGRGLLGQGQDGGHADREMVTPYIVDLGFFDQIPDPGLLQVRELVLVRGRQVRAHAPIMACDDDATPARRYVVDGQILRLQARLVARRPQDVGVFVLAHRADVEHRVGAQHVLRAPRRVLRRSPGDLHSLVVLEKVFVQAHVFGFVGQDGVVGLEAVFF